MANRGVSRVTVTGLGDAIRQTLTLYHQDVNEAIDECSKNAAKDLVKKTKATAPVGYRGSFKRNISSKQLTKSLNGSTYVWYVKAPDYRLTHLLAHGHATRDGGRTRADPFLADAVEVVKKDYEESVKEALRRGK